VTVWLSRDCEYDVSTSMIGSKLSHYTVTSKLGEGGMGEVYQATDTKLGREVAIKVLPEAVASDPERLARFEREAKVLASLNHPHIASIYSFESARIKGRPGTPGGLSSQPLP
jgi:serine/threonine protein kinase